MTASDIPWPEHPRPNFQRSAWINLNGPWAFDFDPQNQGLEGKWFMPGSHEFQRQITVPFPWESRLSGIGNTDYKGVAWYSRDITMPGGKEWKNRDAWLIIGACDWEATVWVNGRPAGKHIGGYAPFEINLSKFSQPGERINLTIRAVDTTDPQQPTGKQINWYTRTSGIWQTVYIESRGKNYIQSIRGIPDIKNGSMAYTIKLGGQNDGGKLILSSPENTFSTVRVEVPPNTQEVQATVKVTEPKLWSPDSPILYPVRFNLHDSKGPADQVHSYFGLREISVNKASGRDYQYIFLNGKPVYLRGALHQSFHPEGIYQYPNDAAIRKDYELTKEFGLNFLRIHIKAPIPRELYWADRLGVLIMQDMPNPWEHTDLARQFWKMTFEQILQRDFNNPSIFAWVLFNETWGLGRKAEEYSPERQQWVEQMYHQAKKLDPTRLCEDNSPCRQDHVITDINSWHFYINEHQKARKHLEYVVKNVYPGSAFNYTGKYRQNNAPLINSEYGGISAGLGDQDISWCLKHLTNEIRKHDKICGYVYTELTDIEWEHNGLANYDRSNKEYGYDFWHPGFTPADINNPDFVVIDTPPCIELTGKKHPIPIKISHWSDYQAQNLMLRYRTIGFDRLGNRHTGPWHQQPAKWHPYQVVEHSPKPTAGFIHNDDMVGAFLVELVDRNKVLARNYINLVKDDHMAPAVEVIDEHTIVLRFSPADFAEWTFKGELPHTKGIQSEKVAGQGTGTVEYRIRIPKVIDPKMIDSITVMAELAAKAGDEKLDWPARKKKFDYPQTDNKKWPTDVILTMNDQTVQTQTLPDDPADARGALSHERYHQGSYGYLTKTSVSGSSLKRILDKVDGNGILRIRWTVSPEAKNRGGLAIFGEKLGCYPVSPSILIRLKSKHGLPKDFAVDEPIVIDPIHR